MKRWPIVFLACCLAGTAAAAGFRVTTADKLSEQIKESPGKYKIVYIFCDYCYASQSRFSRVAALCHASPDIAFFPISAQDTTRLHAYADTCRYVGDLYVFNLNRKKKWFDFYNPNEAACRFLEKHLGVDAEKMGASGICVLDETNRIVETTNYDMNDNEYFAVLSKYVNPNR